MLHSSTFFKVNYNKIFNLSNFEKKKLIKILYDKYIIRALIYQKYSEKVLFILDNNLFFNKYKKNILTHKILQLKIGRSINCQNYIFKNNYNKKCKFIMSSFLNKTKFLNNLSNVSKALKYGLNCQLSLTNFSDKVLILEALSPFLYALMYKPIKGGYLAFSFNGQIGFMPRRQLVTKFIYNFKLFKKFSYFSYTKYAITWIIIKLMDRTFLSKRKKYYNKKKKYYYKKKYSIKPIFYIV